MTDVVANGTLLDAGGTLTTANAKIALEQLRDRQAEQMGGAASSELTIAAGAIVPTGYLHTVDTQADGASDDLDSITTTNTPESQQLIISPDNAARTVVVKHEAGGAGQIHLADDNDFTMDELDKILCLYRSGADWYESWRSYGSSLDDARTYLGLGTAAVLDTGVANNNVIKADATGLPAIDGSQLTDLNTAETRGEYLLVQDQKAQNTAGGGFTSGAWRTRDLNTEVVDEGNVCSLAANQMTLIAGTYYFKISCPALAVTCHQAKLVESTSTVTIYGEVGTSEYSRRDTDNLSIATTRSLISGKFTVTAANVTAGQNIFEVQHQCSFTVLSSGFGTYGNFTTEVYTVVEMWRVD